MAETELYGPLLDEDGNRLPGIPELTRDVESAREEARSWASQSEGTVEDMLGRDTGLLSARQYAEYARDVVRNAIDGPGGGLADIAFSGSYSDLSGAPDLSGYAELSDIENIRPDWTEIQNRPVLDQVATSGRYDDLFGAPTSLSEFDNDAGFLTGYDVTSGDVTQHEGDLRLTESQITDLGEYVREVDVFSGDYSDLSGAPLLSPVATSGNYQDLSGKPDLSSLNDVEPHGARSDFPPVGDPEKVYIDSGTGYMYRWGGSDYVQMTDQTAIWGQISGSIEDQTELKEALEQKAGQDDLFSGRYQDLSGLPDLSVFLTEAPVQSVNGRVGAVAVNTFSGNYADLSGVPDLSQYLTDYVVTENDVVQHQGAIQISESQVTDLGHFSGSYADLSGAPSAVSEFENDAGYLSEAPVQSVNGQTGAVTVQGFSGVYADLSGKPDLSQYLTSVEEVQVTQHQEALSIAESQITGLAYFSGKYSDLTGTPSIPSAVSQLNNDAGFITGYSVSELDVTQHQGALEITESQVTDLSHFSGQYQDLTGTPSLSPVATSGRYSDLTGRPDLSGFLTEAPVQSVNGQTGAVQVFSGAYSDLSGKPDLSQYLTQVSEEDVTQYEGALSVTESQIRDLGSYAPATHSHAVAEVSGLQTALDEKALGSDVFSGLYADLSGKPDLSVFLTEVPSNISVEEILLAGTGLTGDGTDLFYGGSKLTDNGGDTAATWSSLAGDQSLVALSGFDNDTGFITDAGVTSVNGESGQVSVEVFSGLYSDLAGRPDLSVYAETSSLSAVATSGSYFDLSGKPSIPARVSDLTNDLGFITGYVVTEGDVTQHESALSISESQITGLSYFSGDYADLSGTPVIPSATSDLANDSGYVTDPGVTSVNGQSGEVTVQGFSGAYADLTGKPAIPSSTSDLTNDAGFITGYVVTQADVRGHEGAIRLTESQITDLGDYAAAGHGHVIGDVGGLEDALIGKADDTDVFSGAYADLTGTPDLSVFLTDIPSTISVEEITLAGAGLTGDGTDLFYGGSKLTDNAGETSATWSSIAGDQSLVSLSGFANDSGFISDYTVTSGDVTAHESTLSILESQITDLGDYALQGELFSGAYADLTGTPDLSGFITDAPVDSVNGQTGAVEVPTYSDAKARAAVGASLAFPLTYDAVAGEIRLDTSQAQAGQALFFDGESLVWQDVSGTGGTDPEPEPNQPPSFATVPDQTVYANGTPAEIDLSGYASDPEGDALTYALSSTSGDATAELSGSILSIYGVAQGSASVEVEVSDGEYTASTTVSVTVQREVTDFALNANPSSITAGGEVTLTSENAPGEVTYRDANTKAEIGTGTDPGTGYAYTFYYDDPGTYLVEAVSGGAVSNAVEITVEKRNDGPPPPDVNIITGGQAAVNASPPPPDVNIITN